MRSAGEPVSFSHARAPSSGCGAGSYGDGAGAGLAEPVDYSSMIPDPALRQSFSQNVEEVRWCPAWLIPAQPQCCGVSDAPLPCAPVL